MWGKVQNEHTHRGTKNGKKNNNENSFHDQNFKRLMMGS
jgi:hypothetical protein